MSKSDSAWHDTFADRLDEQLADAAPAGYATGGAVTRDLAALAYDDGCSLAVPREFLDAIARHTGCEVEVPTVTSGEEFRGRMAPYKPRIEAYRIDPAALEQLVAKLRATGLKQFQPSAQEPAPGGDNA